MFGRYIVSSFRIILVFSRFAKYLSDPDKWAGRAVQGLCVDDSDCKLAEWMTGRTGGWGHQRGLIIPSGEADFPKQTCGVKPDQQFHTIQSYLLIL